MKLSQQDWVY
uniref:Uncharacterized protein n=1 Tax=Rhizophora mucronata TaxID=61149 RepID=A0A2P2LTL2_RHIMU